MFQKINLSRSSNLPCIEFSDKNKKPPAPKRFSSAESSIDKFPLIEKEGSNILKADLENRGQIHKNKNKDFKFKMTRQDVAFTNKRDCEEETQV